MMKAKSIDFNQFWLFFVTKIFDNSHILYVDKRSNTQYDINITHKDTNIMHK